MSSLLNLISLRIEEQVKRWRTWMIDEGLFVVLVSDEMEREAPFIFMDRDSSSVPDDVSESLV